MQMKSTLIFGVLIIFFTLVLFCLELGRIYAGSISRGDNNSTDVFQYNIFPNVIIDYNGNYANVKGENRWIWPWSTATLMFSLVFFFTGSLAVVSGLKKDYSSILRFLMASILSFFLTIFLIATYATIIAGWKSIYGTTASNALPQYVRLDRNLSAACLSLSCLLTIVFFASCFFSGRLIKAGTRKYHSTPT